MDVSSDPPEVVTRAERATANQQWSLARELWHALACSEPQNRHYRAQLSFARAGELFQAGDTLRAREELEWVLRLVPDHADARAWLRRKRGSRLTRIFRSVL